jgi:endonuclease III
MSNCRDTKGGFDSEVKPESSHASPWFPAVCDVARSLEVAYGENRLGNKRNPLDELAYVMLSGQTNENRYVVAYRNFKRIFPRWTDVLNASEKKIADAISSAGLERQKAAYLRGIAIRLERDFGEVSLRALRLMQDEEAEKYLCTLPGVGIKTARCVLMYSLDREVFPADIHCLRVMNRLGWLVWSGQRGDTLADEAQAGVPPQLRRSLHISFVQHGRKICKPAPRCSVCTLGIFCPFAGSNGPGGE